ncbi:glycosyltransferase [Desulfosporosinus orientis DSM 765]|uniref:Glycosyltransferase n=1 Tax=Desulfosporosinus orientis (strain ATCC 19365 / DSM 765 / NCIMB 8382 / VKM B-1628 / Singapore I) TaxID=768706 RepID=G7WC93_DESOD|nr:glycosyltransferase family 4 protein [Desulfosporosinus orientis]AET70711.1 glycosyltransferase [Desulfosporosinus orientis DSM 765]
MKACILTTAHSPFDERIFHKEANSLAEAGYEVVIVAPHQQSEEKQGIRIRAVDPLSSRLDRIWRLKAIYKEALQENADIYHFHDPDLLPVGLLLSRRHHKPVVYDVHEYYGDSLLTRYWLPKPLRKIVAKTVDRFEKWSAQSFAGIITVNSHMAELFKRKNSEGEILHNYPLKRQFEFPRPDSLKPPVILYLGGINRERGLEVILRAMPLVRQRYPEAICELVGPAETGDLGPEFADLKPWLEQGNVHLRGKVPYEQVPSILAGSSIALVPLLPTLNYQKAIPVKLLEYMAAGLPVVGSRFGYIEEIVQQNQCGLLTEPGDPESLARAVCSLLEDPNKGLKYGHNGWEAFHREYTWEKEQNKLLSLYERILTKKDR